MPNQHARPSTTEGLLLSQVIVSLSYALDLAEGQSPGHSLRTCWIAMRVGEELELGSEPLWYLFYSTLLKDIGCSSNAARFVATFGADDRSTKGKSKAVNMRKLGSISRYVLSEKSFGDSLSKRAGLLWRLLKTQAATNNELSHLRGQQAQRVVKKLGFGKPVVDAIRSLDEHWDGKGSPKGLGGESIPLGARIALLAQVVELVHAKHGPEAALSEAAARSGRWFDPKLVDALRNAAARDGFWGGLEKDGLDDRVVALEPRSGWLQVNNARLDVITEAFGIVVDSKSPFTKGHSARVARLADAIGRRLGLGDERRMWMRRAAHLHDIGRLGVSNMILDKTGELGEAEWEAVKRQPVHAQAILSRLDPFQNLARFVSSHRERLDGQGYPHAVDAEEIELESRIIAVADIYDALRSKRPHRKGMPLEGALETLEEMRGSALDSRCLDALRAHLETKGTARSAA